MRTADPTLTPPELAIMKIVWRLGSVTVRDVYEALRALLLHLVQQEQLSDDEREELLRLIREAK